MTRRAVAWIVCTGAVTHAHAVLHACPICFRVEDGPTASGVRAAIFVLVAVTASVLTACGTFVVRFARRAAAMRPPEPPAAP